MKTTIKVGNLELTIQEAGELYRELHRLFGQQQAAPMPVYPIYPKPWPNYPAPYIGDPIPTPNYPFERPYVVYCVGTA